jgi:hypothetical protein
MERESRWGQSRLQTLSFLRLGRPTPDPRDASADLLGVEPQEPSGLAHAGTGKDVFAEDEFLPKWERGCKCTEVAVHGGMVFDTMCRGGDQRAATRHVAHRPLEDGSTP